MLPASDARLGGESSSNKRRRGVSRDYPPDPDMQNPRKDDRHHLTGAKQRFIEALNTFENTEISKVVKTNSDDAAEIAFAATSAPNLQAFRLISRFGLALETAVVIAALAWGIAR
jgi:hypothetical protein